MRFIRRKHGYCPDHGTERRRLPLICVILMMIGLLTILYFLVVYGLIPVLAMLTPS